jgi:hypothetical protein
MMPRNGPFTGLAWGLVISAPIWILLAFFVWWLTR